MEFQALMQRAVDVRRQYTEFEESKYGRAWTREEVLQGFIGDVGDLAKLTMAYSGIRDIPDAEEKMVHELADCLWSVLVLSEMYGVDLEQAFIQTMDELERQLTSRKQEGTLTSA